MTANDRKSYLSYLNKLFNTYHHSIKKKSINVDYSALTEKTETNLKILSLKFIRELKLITIKIFLVKVTLKIAQENYLAFDSVFKTNP